MNIADLAFLIDYNYWANKCILDHAAKLTDAQLNEPQSPGISAGSFRQTLVHVMGAEWIWRMRMQHDVSPTALPQEAEFPTLSSLTTRWAEEERLMREFVATLTDDSLAAVVNYNSTNGAARANIRAHCLTHVVFHGMQHRSECAVLLTNYGFSPGNIDLIYYMFEKGVA